MASLRGEHTWRSGVRGRSGDSVWVVMPDDTEALPLLRGERLGAQLLVRLVVTVALLTVFASAACAVLASLAIWRPVVAVPVLLALTAGSAWLSRLVPIRPLPVWSSTALVVVALGCIAWAGLTHSEQILPRRDPGSYLQSSIALAKEHRSPIVVDAEEIGGPTVLDIPGVTLASPAFFQTGTAAQPRVQPQFLIGPPTWYSIGYWVGGVEGMLWIPAVFGGLGVLAIGLLTGAVVGARWAPLGAVGTALCFPLLHTDRATYSEPPAVFVLTVGLLLVVEATRAGARGRWRPARAAGLLAGVLVGGGGLIRADALRETILLLPIAALLLVRRDGAGAPLLWGAGIATVVSAAAGLGLSDQYLGSIGASLIPLALLGIAMAGLAAVVVVAARRGVRLPRVIRRGLPGGAAALVLLIGAALASRPLWQTVRQSAADPGSRVVAGLQLRQGLTVDGGRTYAEQSLAWTTWWTGPIAVAITFVVLAIAARRLALAWTRDERLPAWSGVLMLGFASAVLTWVRPGITPDHPWADRRLFVVLPLVVVCVVAAAAWLTRWSTRRMPAAVLVLASVGTAATLLVPMTLATWPHLGERVERGEAAAVEQVCLAFAPGDVALMVDDRAANEWPQVVRGQCEVPALSLTAATRHDPARREVAVSAVASAVAGAGRRLVLLSADSAAGGAGDGRVPAKALDTTVREDARLLESRPDALVTLALQVWLAPVG